MPSFPALLADALVKVAGNVRPVELPWLCLDERPQQVVLLRGPVALGEDPSSGLGLLFDFLVCPWGGFVSFRFAEVLATDSGGSLKASRTPDRPFGPGIQDLSRRRTEGVRVRRLGEVGTLRHETRPLDGRHRL